MTDSVFIRESQQCSLYKGSGGILTGIVETLFITTFIAGVAGTGLGGLVGVKRENRQVWMTCRFGKAKD